MLSLKSLVRSWFRASPRQVKRPIRRTVSLRVESLEGRALPSASPLSATVLSTTHAGHHRQMEGPKDISIDSSTGETETSSNDQAEVGSGASSSLGHHR
jgi:hypothetical protein